MKVAIIMGSNSDWPILEPAEKTLKEFGVEVEVVVASAHLSHLYRSAKRTSDSLYLVARNGDSDSRTADNDSSLSLSVCYCLSYCFSIDWIIHRCC